jgi:hypothetical protein
VLACTVVLLAPALRSAVAPPVPPCRAQAALPPPAATCACSHQRKGSISKVTTWTKASGSSQRPSSGSHAAEVDTCCQPSTSFFSMTWRCNLHDFMSQQLHLGVQATPEGYAKLSLDGCLQLVDRCWWRFIIVTTTSTPCPTYDHSVCVCILMLLVPASSCKAVTRSLSGAFELHKGATATGNRLHCDTEAQPLQFCVGCKRKLCCRFGWRLKSLST